MNQRPDHAGAHASTARTAYEASVIHRAMARAGSNPQLKGHLHEVLVQDRLNLRNLLAGATLQAARSGGATGAWIGAGVETVRGLSDLIDGRRDAGEVLVSVAGAGAKGYATGAAASAAATAGGAMLASGLTAVGVGAGAAAVAAPLAVAVGVGWVVSSLWDSVFG